MGVFVKGENMNSIKFKRIYDEVENSDGYRVLVDRLWPRGITKEKAQIDEWPKSITPTAELRKAYHGGAIDYDTFLEKYCKELSENHDTEVFIESVKSILEKSDITLLSSVKELEFSHVPILKSYIEKHLK